MRNFFWHIGCKNYFSKGTKSFVLIAPLVWQISRKTGAALDNPCPSWVRVKWLLTWPELLKRSQSVQAIFYSLTVNGWEVKRRGKMGKMGMIDKKSRCCVPSVWFDKSYNLVVAFVMVDLQEIFFTLSIHFSAFRCRWCDGTGATVGQYSGWGYVRRLQLRRSNVHTLICTRDFLVS